MLFIVMFLDMKHICYTNLCSKGTYVSQYNFFLGKTYGHMWSIWVKPDIKAIFRDLQLMAIFSIPQSGLDEIRPELLFS